jgi:MFS family permease
MAAIGPGREGPSASDAGTAAGGEVPVLGLRPNRQQFALLVLVNGFVGAAVGSERAVLPLLGSQVFALTSSAAVLSFIATFGLAKAASNLLAGPWSNQVGRKRVLLIGWLVGLPVPLILILTPPPHWWLIVAANALLGANQGLCWSMTVIAKIDLVGPTRRGLALGLNEFAGYLAVGGAAFATAFLASAYGVRPVPFLFMLGAIVAGLTVSALAIRETLPFARAEAQDHEQPVAAPSFRSSFRKGSWSDRTLFACAQAGLVNNLNDAALWGLVPLLLLTRTSDITSVGTLVALYPASWGLGQLLTGAASDRFGRKGFIVGGMLLQAGSIALLVIGPGYLESAAAMLGLGIGTAAVYPTLLGAVSDTAHPAERAALVGVYRFWRDLGYPAGALLGGLLADKFGFALSLWTVGLLTALSGLIFAAVGRETLPRPA